MFSRRDVSTFAVRVHTNGTVVRSNARCGVLIVANTAGHVGVWRDSTAGNPPAVPALAAATAEPVPLKPVGRSTGTAVALRLRDRGGGTPRLRRAGRTAAAVAGVCLLLPDARCLRVCSSACTTAPPKRSAPGPGGRGERRRLRPPAPPRLQELGICARGHAQTVRHSSWRSAVFIVYCSR